MSSSAAGASHGDQSDSAPAYHQLQTHHWTDEEDDDDDIYVPATDDGVEDDDTVEDEEESHYHDASEELTGLVEFDWEVQEEEEEEEDDDDDEEEEQDEDGDDGPPHAGGSIYLSRDQIIRLLGNAGMGRFLTAQFGLPRRHYHQDEDGEEDIEQETGYGGVGRTRRGRGKDAFQPVPSEQGRKLMDSGVFGSTPRAEDTLKRQKRLAYQVMRRELGLGGIGRQRASNKAIAQTLIPGTEADSIIHYNSRCYSGQFSDDGNFFFSCAQDFRVRMYDTSNPYDWKYYKTVVYPSGHWTITDASLSPDNRFLAYSSIQNIVCLASTDPDNDSDPTWLDILNTGSTNPRAYNSYFSVWSVRFSGDGRELVAGTAENSVYVYDIEQQRSILRIPGHEGDVNAVCFGDKQSPHILYSGSDDTTLKVWDRRSMGDGRAAGVFFGHTEGLTYVDSKGDGRYVLSNGKDQTAKLWDLRKMMSADKADRIRPSRYTTHFEYRSNSYDVNDYRPHPHDSSLVTFRGHKVLRTLIRCHFSPPGSTDSRYVYSGSYDGSVYVWNLDATLAGKIDVLQATRHRPRSPSLMEASYDIYGRDGGYWQTCVRDASWHPNAPVIAATSWNGWDAAQGTCSVHTWNDGMEDDEAEPKMGRRVNAQLQHDDRLYRRVGSRNTPYSALFFGADEDDDD